MQPYIQKQILALQAGSTVAYLSISMLKRLNIILPPLSLQNQFSDFVALKRCGQTKAYLLEGGGTAQVVTEGVISKMSLPYQKKLIPRAQELRKKATKQESHLRYDFLHNYPVRFQRQKTIDSFIADFYCHEARLVIELDGSQHYDEQGLAYDKERSAIFAEYSVKVVRFSNLEVEKNFQGVCTAIDLTVKARMQALIST